MDIIIYFEVLNLQCVHAIIIVRSLLSFFPKFMMIVLYIYIQQELEANGYVHIWKLVRIYLIVVSGRGCLVARL